MPDWTLSAALAALLTLGVAPAFAEDKPNQDIDSAAAEATEDCEDLREALEAEDEDGTLDSFDEQELTRKGC